MKTPPKRIYLQFYGNGPKTPGIEREGVTWCQDRINKSDVQYVLIMSRNKSRNKTVNRRDQIDMVAIEAEKLTVGA